MTRCIFLSQYPHSNIRLVMSELTSALSCSAKELMAALMTHDPEDAGVVTESNFRSVLRQFAGFKLSEHQTVTLCRHFRQPRRERDPVGANTKRLVKSLISNFYII